MVPPVLETSWAYSPISCQVIYFVLALTHTHRLLFFFLFKLMYLFFSRCCANSQTFSLRNRFVDHSKKEDKVPLSLQLWQDMCMGSGGTRQFLDIPSPFEIVLSSGQLFHLIQQVCMGPCMHSACSNVLGGDRSECDIILLLVNYKTHLSAFRVWGSLSCHSFHGQDKEHCMKYFTSEANTHIPPGGSMHWFPIWDPELRFQISLHSVWPASLLNRNPIQHAVWAIWHTTADEEKGK